MHCSHGADAHRAKSGPLPPQNVLLYLQVSTEDQIRPLFLSTSRLGTGLAMSDQWPISSAAIQDIQRLAWGCVQDMAGVLVCAGCPNSTILSPDPKAWLLEKQMETHFVPLCRHHANGQNVYAASWQATPVFLHYCWKRADNKSGAVISRTIRTYSAQLCYCRCFRMF